MRPASGPGARLASAVLAAALLAPAAAHARCAAPAEVGALTASLRHHLRATAPRTTDRPAPRPPAPPPSCAGSAVDEAVRLAAADAADPASSAQRRCEAAVARATERFLSRRLAERLAGERAERRSRRAFRTLARRCEPALRGGTPPRLGAACAATLDGTNAAAAAARLGGCLRAVSARLVDSVAPTPLPPSIVVVLTDDQRWDTLDVMPAVRREMSERGVEFSESFVPTALCCPSRASLFSGQYAHHHGVRGNGPPMGGAPLFDGRHALPVWLRAAGYRTALFGKYMNANQRLAPAFPPGWDVWQTFVENAGRSGEKKLGSYYDYTLNENGVLVRYGDGEQAYSTDLLRERTLDFVRASAAGPFFVVYAPFAPHTPALPARRHAGRFAGLAPARPPSWLEADVSDKPPWVRFFASRITPQGVARSDALRVLMLESLLAVDEAVAALSAELERLGLTDDTVLVFTSDNGYLWREHWWGWKMVAYEESIRVPLVVRYPRLVPLARRVDALVLNIDLAPTFAELAGVPIPTPVDGRSLVPLLVGESAWREDFLIENWARFLVMPYVAIRTARWKLVRSDTTTAVFEELYDLGADPYEMDNLALDPSTWAVRDALAARLDALRAD